MFSIEVDFIPNEVRAPVRGPYVSIEERHRVKRLLPDRFETQSGAKTMVSLIMKGLGHQSIDPERMADIKLRPVRAQDRQDI